MRSTTLRRALALVAALVAAALVPMLPAAAVPAPVQTVSVSIVQPAPSLSPDGTFSANVVTDLSADAEYFEVRLRLRSPSGRLIYQKTEVRHNVTAGRQVVAFSRALADLDVAQGRYPIEVRVLATGASATEATSRALVVEPDADTVPVVVVARLTCSPAIDPAGRFVVDPELYPRSRSDAQRVTEVIARHPGADITLALPPILVEEWLRASDGYEVSGAEGVVEVPKSAPAALASEAVLERVRETLANPRVTFLDVPYAEPDLAAMARIDALGDLRAHWAMSDTVVRTALEATPTPGTAFEGDALPAAALPYLERRGLEFAIVGPAALQAGETTAPTGVYSLGGSKVRALVLDPGLDAAAENDTDAFYDALFDRLVSKHPGNPVVMVFDIGPGTEGTPAGLERALDMLGAAEWVTTVSAADAARYPSPTAARLVANPPADGAPEGYWTEVGKARGYAGAIIAALGPKDADAQTAQTAVLVAESRCWAGPDGSYSLADRGRAYAASASRYVSDLFSTVSIQGRDVTLSDRNGNVPVSVVNGSGKSMRVVVRATSGSISLPRAETTITLDPGENVLTIPVNMRSELSDTLNVTVTAGAVTLAQTDIRVQASYLDKLATVGMVVLFLLGLLVFIRRRVREAIAGTIETDDGDDAPGR